MGAGSEGITSSLQQQAAPFCALGYRSPGWSNQRPDLVHFWGCTPDPGQQFDAV